MLREVFIEEGKKHPELETVDLLKLLYQQVYGGEHLAIDFEDSLEKLEQEWALLFHENGEESFFDIGNGYVRLNLKTVKTIEEIRGINRIFTAKSQLPTGSDESFLEGAALLILLADEGKIPIDKNTMIMQIDNYLKEGIRPIHHSEVYGSAYKPAYRVVEKDLVPLLPIIKRIEEAQIGEEPLIIGVDGRAGAGKTTIAKKLKQIYDVPVIPLDHFFLPPSLRIEERLKEKGGNIDYDRFIKEVIAPINAAGKTDYRIFDCTVMDFVGTASVPQSSIIICEGSYSLHPKFREFYDLKIFVTCTGDTQQQRILHRNDTETYDKYMTQWIPIEEEYFKECNVENSCHITIHTDSF